MTDNTPSPNSPRPTSTTGLLQLRTQDRFGISSIRYRPATAAPRSRSPSRHVGTLFSGAPGHHLLPAAHRRVRQARRPGDGLTVVLLDQPVNRIYALRSGPRRGRRGRPHAADRSRPLPAYRHTRRVRSPSHRRPPRNTTSRPPRSQPSSTGSASLGTNGKGAFQPARNRGPVGPRGPSHSAFP